MYGNVILEGPDGGGKTTLIRHFLQKGMRQHPRASHSTGGPVPALDTWVTNHSNPGTGWVFDRHPLISEPIYGPICRGKVPGQFNDPRWVEEETRRCAADNVLVLCLPPQAIARENAGKDGQMVGVLDHYDEIYNAYLRLWWPGVIIRYDYTRRWNVSDLMAHIDQVIDEMAFKQVTY